MADEQDQPLTSFSMGAEVTYTVDASDITANIRGKKLIDFIGEIDDEKGSYYFSEILYRVYSDMREMYLREKPELNAMTLEDLIEKFMAEEGQ